MVVFPHISLKEYQDRGLDQIIPTERALFLDDLAPEGEIRCDPSGGKFRTRLANAFLFPFHGLSGKEVHLLGSLIYPIIKFIPPKRLGTCKMRFQQEVQARAALTLKAGRRLIKGPPGSGKTLILIHRCCFLQKYQPRMKRILLVCYNVVLVSYLKRLLQEKGVGVGGEGVQVLHFYDVCFKIMGMKVEYDKADSGYYDYIVQTTLETLNSGLNEAGTFDVILVDEGQDFRDDMFKVILGLLKPEGDLVIALDDYQDLYRKEGSWKSLGIEARGGSRILQRVYRSTETITGFAQRFIGETSLPKAQLDLFSDDQSCSDPVPEIIRFENETTLGEFLLTDIREQHRLGEFQLSEIAILYDDKLYGSEGFRYKGKEVPMGILKKLESAGIPTNWVSQDIRAKELFDITTDRVSLISIHSAKGLDFDLVYLMGVDQIIPTDETRDRLIRLLYVAITRAKYRLVIPYVEEAEVIIRLKACLPDH
jgi:superfamily I DNA and RNA helicase